MQLWRRRSAFPPKDQGLCTIGHFFIFTEFYSEALFCRGYHGNNGRICSVFFFLGTIGFQMCACSYHVMHFELLLCCSMCETEMLEIRIAAGSYIPLVRFSQISAGCPTSLASYSQQLEEQSQSRFPQLAARLFTTYAQSRPTKLKASTLASQSCLVLGRIYVRPSLYSQVSSICARIGTYLLLYIRVQILCSWFSFGLFALVRTHLVGPYLYYTKLEKTYINLAGQRGNYARNGRKLQLEREREKEGEREFFSRHACTTNRTVISGRSLQQKFPSKTLPGRKIPFSQL